MIITIDGPVASGKSTVAQVLAQRFNFYYLYTGLLYRAIAYALVKTYGYSELDLASPKSSDLDELLASGRIVYMFHDGMAHIVFDGTDITNLLKTEYVDQISSISSANSLVRSAVYRLQQSIATGTDIVADGRDTGSVVFPRADVKFFLTASVEERARRWRNDQVSQGNAVTLSDAITAVNMRDQRDKTRKISPLIQAADAILIDNSSWSIDETIERMVQVVVERFPILGA
jgi:cytidylate kinase